MSSSVAFVAIAGMLSFAEDASACGSESNPAAQLRACCAMRRSAECGCCGQVESSPPLASLLHADEVRLQFARAGLTSRSCDALLWVSDGVSSPAPSERPAQRVKATFALKASIAEPCGIVSLTVRPSLAFHLATGPRTRACSSHRSTFVRHTS